MIFKIYLFLLLVASTLGIQVFLIGGGQFDNQSSIFQAIAKQTGKSNSQTNCTDDWTQTKCPKVAVATSSAPNQDAGNQAYNVNHDPNLSYKNLFIKYGFSPKHISIHIDNYIQTADTSTEAGQYNLDILMKADVLFFSTGDQSKHIRSWFKDSGDFNELGQVIYRRAKNNTLILVGTSAGCMIMGPFIYGQGSSFGHWYFSGLVGLAPKAIQDGQVNGTGLKDTRNGTFGLQYEQNGGFLFGFNSIPYFVDAHFGAEGRLVRIASALLQLHIQIGIGVDQTTCLFYDDGIGKVIGKNAVYIVDVSQAHKDPSKYFSASKVKMHYLTFNDTYNFSQKSVHSSKQLITKPKYSGHYDSNDLLKEYECETIATRLIDQTASYNIGYAVTPTQFPANTPKFKLFFRKTQNSKGYYEKTKGYTIEDIQIDYQYQ